MKQKNTQRKLLFNTPDKKPKLRKSNSDPIKRPKKMNIFDITKKIKACLRSDDGFHQKIKIIRNLVINWFETTDT